MDKYTMRDYKFIWGHSKDAREEPSFFSWDDIYIYQNQKTGRYFMHIDTSFYEAPKSAEAARGELDRLSEIESAFRNFLTENEQPLRAEICFADLQDYGAQTLSALYTQFKIFYDGYKKYKEELE